MKLAKVTKNFRIEVAGSKPVVIRQTTTVQHACKHAAYAAELRITVRVVDNRTEVVVLELPAIDREHSIKPKCKRDRRYARMARKTN